ncbi:MAG: hypothetical protein U0163_17770 [Gemmatimonadaceae bacterium]
MRYFLAKASDGPVLIIAERIDEIAEELSRRGWLGQFHPSYTRMVPAHHITTLRLVGCPDPNPVYRRFFDPPRGTLPKDLDVIGKAYVGASLPRVAQLARSPGSTSTNRRPLLWRDRQWSSPADALQALLDSGQSPARLKAFTLSVDGESDDARQARAFLSQVDLEMLGETIEVPSSALDPFAAVAIIEDYKPLDVECAAVNLCLRRNPSALPTTGNCWWMETAATRTSRTTRSRRTLSSPSAPSSTTGCSIKRDGG